MSKNIRNKPCECGSGIKTKKCCGDPKVRTMFNEIFNRTDGEKTMLERISSGNVSGQITNLFHPVTQRHMTVRNHNFVCNHDPIENTMKVRWKVDKDKTDPYVYDQLLEKNPYYLQMMGDFIQRIIEDHLNDRGFNVDITTLFMTYEMIDRDGGHRLYNDFREPKTLEDSPNSILKRLNDPSDSIDLVKEVHGLKDVELKSIYNDRYEPIFNNQQ